MQWIKIYKIWIRGVSDYGIHPLCYGAILSNIRAISHESLHKTELHLQILGKNGVLDVLKGGQLWERDLLQFKEHIFGRLEDKYLFIFEFSYGGSIVVVGEDWELTEEDGDC
jgi:hypothetical protein